MEHVYVSTRNNNKSYVTLRLLELAVANGDPINFNIFGQIVRYVPERTGKRVIKTNERPGKTVFNQWFVCSECAHPLNPNDKFCHECGAKVVE